MLKEKTWFGKEVEGRYYGLETQFIRETKDVEISSEVGHLYFTRECLNDNESINFIEKICKYSTTPITVECDCDTFKFITPVIHSRVHILYRIKLKEIKELKNTDSISIDFSTYDTIVFTKYTGLSTTPDKYMFDTLK